MSTRTSSKNLLQFSFEAVIDDEDSRFAFREFLETQKNLEPLLFIEHVELYVLLKSEANRFKTAKQIITDFIQTPIARYELNISSPMRQKLIQGFAACSESSCPRFLFEEVYAIVMFELKQDCFQRFLKSGEFEVFIEKKMKKDEGFINKLLKNSAQSTTVPVPITVTTAPAPSITVIPPTPAQPSLNRTPSFTNASTTPSGTLTRCSSLNSLNTAIRKESSSTSSDSSSSDMGNDDDLRTELDAVTDLGTHTQNIAPQTEVSAHEELFFAFSRPYTGVPIRDRKKNLFKNYVSCFSGAEACTWLCSYLKIEREEAVFLAAFFLQKEWITNANYRKKSKGHFIDSDKHLYRFVQKKKVVIVGGGFGGCVAAKALQNDFDVTLIDSKPAFEYILDFPTLFSDPSGINKISTPYNQILKKGHILSAQVHAVSPQGVFLTESLNERRSSVVSVASAASNGSSSSSSGSEGAGKMIPYDYLILSTGCKYTMPFPIDEVSQSICIYPYSSASILGHFAQLRESKRVVVIGGGALGLEIVGEICAAYKSTQVYLISQRNVLLERQCPAVHKRAVKLLAQYPNLKLLLSRKVSNISNKTVYYKFMVEDEGVDEVQSSSSSSSDHSLNEEHSLEADLICVCGGVEPRTDVMTKYMPYTLNVMKQVTVNEKFQVVQPAPSTNPQENRMSMRFSSVNLTDLGATYSKSTSALLDMKASFFKNIFAIGDCCSVKEEKLAQNAMLHGAAVAANIKAIEKGKNDASLTIYKPGDRLQIISCGPSSAIMIKGEKVLTDGAIMSKIKGLVKMKVMLGIR